MLDSDVHDRGVEAANRWLTALLVGSAVGVYLLIAVGATTALLRRPGTCPTWPACNGAWLPQQADPALLAAWGHRAGALVIGLLLLATLWHAVQTGRSRRIRAGIAAAVLLYPLQIGIGAVTVGGASSTAASAAHLILALAIFGAICLALLWHLEAGHPATAPPSTSSNTHGDPSAIQPSIEAAPDPTPPSPGERIRGYIRLTKPKLWWLLCLVALAAMGLAAGRRLEIETIIATSVGGVLAIAAAGTFNHVLERDLDQQMARTADRPLVDGVIPARNAVAFGVALSGASIAVFLAFVNVLATALAILAILFYAIGYTLVLKPNTSQNIVLGGAVGAFPALIGWAAVENTVGIPAIVLGAVIFLWTPAHFYNLALAYRDDYARAGIPMLPVVSGGAVTRRHILLYLAATMAGAVLLGTTTTLGWVYAVSTTVVGAVFLVAVVGLHRQQSDGAAMRAFHASNAYLGILLVTLIVDTLAI
jgi:protoheme IX farnesyltransferase